MSPDEHETSFGEAVREHPSFDAGVVRQTKPSDLVYRFLAGAITSAVAGVITVAFGPKAGGLFLAFLGASLTLIEEQEDSVEAREDARGAMVGAVALAVFAVVAALVLPHVVPALSLVIAAIAWGVVARGRVCRPVVAALSGSCSCRSKRVSRV